MQIFNELTPWCLPSVLTSWTPFQHTYNQAHLLGHSERSHGDLIEFLLRDIQESKNYKLWKGEEIQSLNVF